MHSVAANLVVFLLDKMWKLMRMYLPGLLAFRVSGCFGPCPSRRVFVLEMIHLEISQRWQVREQLMMVTLWGIFPKHKQFFCTKQVCTTACFQKVERPERQKIPLRRPVVAQAASRRYVWTNMVLGWGGWQVENSAVGNVNIPLRTWQQATALVNELQRLTC